MTTEQSVGAASHSSVHWREIDWRSVNGSVRRLQVRIVKAVEAGRWGKVKALQRLLTSSRNGKLLAVRRVTENAGKKTSGVDGVSWNTPEKKMAAVDTLKRRDYRPLPLRRIYIPKSNGKLRPLGIPSMNELCHAGALPAGARSGGRDEGGWKLVRVPSAAFLRRCYRRLLQRPRSQFFRLGTRRRHPGLFRQHQP